MEVVGRLPGLALGICVRQRWSARPLARSPAAAACCPQPRSYLGEQILQGCRPRKEQELIGDWQGSEARERPRVDRARVLEVLGGF